MDNSRILTRRQAADYLNVGLSLLDKTIHRQDNPLPHIQVGKRVVIPRDALDAWIDAEIMRNGGATEV